MSNRSRLAIFLVATLVLLAGCSSDNPGETPTPVVNDSASNQTASPPTDSAGSSGQNGTEESTNASNKTPTETETVVTESAGDTKPPRVTITQPNNGYSAPSNATQIIVKFRATDSGSGVDFSTLSVVESVSGKNLTNRVQQTGSTVSVPVSVESDSVYTVEVSVGDKLGNRVTKTVTFSVQAETSNETETNSTDDETTNNGGSSSTTSGGDSEIPPPTEPDNSPPNASVSPENVVVSVNESARFDASDSSDPDGDSLNFSWAFGDGLNGVGSTVSHSYASAGNYTVNVTVDDGWGGTDTEEVNVTVRPPNKDPVADAGNNTSALVGVPESFSAVKSYDPDNDSLSYQWTFGDGSTATGMNVSHTYSSDGNYTVTLNVTDSRGGYDTTTVGVVVRTNNSEPIADAGSDFNVSNLSTAGFYGGGSSDPNNDSLSYQWSFGDGGNGTGVFPNHTYTERGTFAVTLTVTDEFGAQDTDTVNVTVENNPPVANFSTPTEPLSVNSSHMFDAANSSDLDGDNLTYRWDFGDGATSKGVEVSHQYNKTGNFTVSVTVTDGHGGYDTVTKTVTVENQPPSAVMTGDNETVVNFTESYSASKSSDPNNDSLTYTWQFPNATTTGENVSYTFDSAGTYTVNVTVSDGNSNTSDDTDSMNITVRSDNSDPVAKITGPSTVYNMSTAKFDGGNSSDPEGDSLSYEWTFETPSGTVSEYDRLADVTYTSEGVYNVTLNVTDEFGAYNVTTVTVDVVNNPPSVGIVQDSGVYPVNGSLTFDANTSDADGDNLSHSWDFAGLANGSGTSASHTFNSTGTYNVTLNVTDEHGAVNQTTITLDVQNTAPTADAGNNQTVVIGDSAMVDGSSSFDPNGDSLGFDWVLYKNGSLIFTSTSESFNYTFSELGTYEADLTVTDGNESTANDSDSSVIEVINNPPNADAGGDFNATVNTSVTFNGTGTTEPDGHNLTFNWDFDDGTVANDSGPTPSHTFNSTGTYNVTLTTIDEYGAKDTDVVTVTVTK